APLAPREPPLSLLPYVPRVPHAALPGKLTATTFALERPCCVFDRHANASDAVWLVVAFANASDAFRNPPSRADVPLYEQLPAARSYMTLEMPAATYACSVPSPAVLRVGDDTACGDQGGWDPCNGPLPSPGPYRGLSQFGEEKGPLGGGRCGGAGRAPRTPPDASACLSLQRRGVEVPVPPGFGNRHLLPQVLQDPPHPPGPAPAPAPRLQVQPPGAGLLSPPASRSPSCRVNSHFTSTTASSLPGCGTMHPLLCLPPRSRTSLVLCLPGPRYRPRSAGPVADRGTASSPKPPRASAWRHLVTGGPHAGTGGVCGDPRGGRHPGVAHSAPLPG
uniref:Uroplakin 3B n=1 Tax=Accipiter nisus TaxID=211598 RepID=A0A8B9M1J1_9AVES